MAKVPTQQFQATIYKQGPNPFVDVPEQVSLSFSDCAQAGRISVEGKLNETSIRTTLVPVGKGKHRLYVNGGMRSAAGVGVGDTVVFTLRVTAPEVVNPPGDVIAALKGSSSALAAFDALSPSHRRELLRYIDDARTTETRQQRIQKMVEYILGKESKEAQRRSSRPLWACPKCGNEFVNKNQYHSCKRYTLDSLFANKPADIRKLFDRFRKIVEACGPVKVLPYRDKVGFMVRVRFVGAVPKTRWMDIGFWLTRRIENSRFHKIETIYPNAHVHLLRITELEQLDHQVAEWTKEAYRVGCQEHPG